MKNEIFNLRKVAIGTRKKFESKKIGKNKLKKLYMDYNPIMEIDLFLNEAEKSFPGLNCGLAALYLRDILKKGKIINGKYRDQDHSFLLINNIVVDITADQYDGPEVYVEELKYPWRII